MKVLIFSSKEEDYLQDSIIHGFKMLLGKDAVEFPTKLILYDDYKNSNKIRGGGFTLYKLIDHNLKPNLNLDIEEMIEENFFDLIVFSSIYRQYDVFYKYYRLLKRKKVWVFDGEDTSVIFPYYMRFYKELLFFSKPHFDFFYFKRELYENSYNRIHILSNFTLNKNKFLNNIKTISFSIPQEKIVKNIPHKTKLFTSHIVDEEVSTKVGLNQGAYLFSEEKDYYFDIQTSKFGITMKRGGWDCLRHYEIAANGTIICFKNLEKKPIYSAPHGLVHGYNCISYETYEDLMNKISNVTYDEYKYILSNSLSWVEENSTMSTICRLLKKYY